MDGVRHSDLVEFVDLGRMSYAAAYRVQCDAHERVVASRPPIGEAIIESQPAGAVYFVEHDPPVITVSRRKDAHRHVLLSTEQLAGRGVQCVETDRGGDVTWHGPGQIVVYLVLDLNRLGLRVHGYLRMLEGAVIDTLAEFGVRGVRDPAATGVWVDEGKNAKKICAMGVRLSRWVSMHGIALNVHPDLSSFDLIVPCGLVGRGVTSLARQFPDAAPTMDHVKKTLALRLLCALEMAAQQALRRPETTYERP